MIVYATVERYCPMCNRKRLTNREDVGPFVVTTCAYCGHIHSIKDLFRERLHESRSPDGEQPTDASFRGVGQRASYEPARFG